MKNLDNLSHDTVNLLFISKNIALNLGEDVISLEHLMLSFTLIDSPVNDFYQKFKVSFEYINKKLFKSLVNFNSLQNTKCDILLDGLVLQLEKRIISCFELLYEDSSDDITDLIYPEDLFLSMLQSNDISIKRIISLLFGQPIKDEDWFSLNEFHDKTETLLDKINPSKNNTNKNHSNTKPFSENKCNMENLLKYGINLNEKAMLGTIPLISRRDLEINRIIEILGRKYKNNPCLIGEPGVGKTSIVEALALKITTKDVPGFLKNSIIISLDIAAILAGTKYRGDFEARLKSILVEASSNTSIILFIDEIHNISLAGGSDGAINCSNILKPYLARGDIKCIGSTTFSEYKKYIESDSALARRFQKISINEPSIDDSILMLKRVKSSYEKYHNISITNDAIDSAVNLSARYITDRYLPDKAFDLLDEACSKNKIFAKKCPVTSKDIADVLYTMTGIPVNEGDLSLSKTILKLDKSLSDKIVGQEDAISSIVKALIRSTAGLNDENRPVASFIFDGPTGVGKTYLARLLSLFIFGNEQNLIRIDMSEYMEKWSVSKLIGSTPGYIGYGEGGLLTEAVRRKPYSVILFDEIEKAHPDIINIFLQILDYGAISDGEGNKIDFKNTIIIFTSNLYVPNTKKTIGLLNNSNEDNNVKHKAEAIKLFESNFSPEFVNRLDEVIVFNSLNNIFISKILDLTIKELKSQLLRKGITLSIGKKGKEFLLSKCDSFNFGARHVRRVVSKYLIDDISLMIVQNKLSSGDKLKITASLNSINYDIVKDNISNSCYVESL